MIALSELYRDIRDVAAVREIVSSTESWLSVSGAPGSLERLVVGALWQAEQKQMLYLTATGESRRQAYEDLSELIGAAHLAEYRGPEPGGRYHEDRELIRIVEQTDTLRALHDGWQGIMVMTPESLLQRVSEPERVEQSTSRLNVGEEVRLTTLEVELISKGFEQKPFIEVPGDYAIRGGIFDIYPFVGKHPLRLEFWGDMIESIREFDELTQRSIRELPQAVLVPNLNERTAGEQGGVSSLLRHLQRDCRVVIGHGVRLAETLDKRYDHLISPRARREELDRYIPPKLLIEELDLFRRVSFNGVEEGGGTVIDLGAELQPAFHGNVEMFAEVMNVARAQGMTCYVLCEGDAQIRRMQELLEGKGSYEVIPDSLHSGFVFPAAKKLVFTEHQLFDRYRRREVEGQRQMRRGMSLRELRDLKPGDYVVHTDHGIGKFVGLEKIRVRGAEQESLKVIYDEQDVLYVNINKLNRIQKYSSEEGHTPKLNRLGSDAWERSKARTKGKIKDIARELIRLYARRRMEPGFSFGPDTHWQTELEASFMYEDTPDQASATVAVKADMENPHPMDRLVCGDVGFGKTEIAIRAAFKAVMGGKQVAVLVPTTVLAQQHYETFCKRISRFPVKVAMVSRFRTAGEIKETLRKTAGGEVDILIGTHRLISKDVTFKDLGLLVIDEEQRFGVTTKEKLKEMRAAVDTLTLTATPIPRTLHLSLMGARDLSIIATPPRNRQPVQTELHAFGPDVIREAIQYEMGRKGQIFLVHNRVRSIESMADYVRKLVPTARVRVAHGQMSGHHLEQVMLDFGEHKFDVLVSSAIIENGLDVPNANTMIVNRADRFGLAQLYQLRGRVGRSNQRAFCYLLTPPFESLPKDSIRRLEAIEEFTDLGSGFNVAMRDLDIRGAGNLLGSAQSGYIETVGFEMYQRLISEAVAELKLDEFSDVFPVIDGPMQREEERPDTQVEVDADAYLPEHYVENNMERLQLYRRLNDVSEPTQLQEMAAELRDRFGRLPTEAETLLKSIELRLTAQRGGFVRADLSKNRLVVQFPGRESQQFYEGGRFDQILASVVGSKGQYRLIESGKSLRLEMPVAGGDEPMGRIEGAIIVLNQLGVAQ